jgi:phosphate uptake regulator
MAAEVKKRDRVPDVERLAAQLFAALFTSPAGRAKTPESLAQDALSAARAFYRAADEPEQPKG